MTKEEKTMLENLERLEATIKHLKEHCLKRTPAEVRQFLTTNIKEIFQD